ncbi:MAG: methionyl-tRNA formyltransferase [Candidatus Omnitrophota bacterium]
MKIIFFGTGEFALPSLKKVIAADHDLMALVTQPDSKKSRGWNVQATPTKALIEKLMPGMAIFQPEKLDNAFIEQLKGPEADIFIVVDYGKILPKEILNIPQKYCINLHPSLLPKYRGSSPINRAILNGDAITGNTVIEMSERMDAGRIILQEEIRIKEREDSTGLFARLSLSGADLILKTLNLIEEGKETVTEQDESKASYAPKLKKEDGEIDWTLPAVRIERSIRGLQPWPGAFTYIGNKRLKILKADIAFPEDGINPPGTVSLKKGLTVYTADGAIRVKMLQIEGKKPMPADEFMKGNALKEGMILGKTID